MPTFRTTRRSAHVSVEDLGAGVARTFDTLAIALDEDGLERAA